MSLSEYRRRRRFDVTPEPSEEVPARHTKRKSLRYVIQKHRGSHLHYDFRLEWKGVLLSWAIPKGPSLDPAVKRLAMPTEDHPLEYADFEGVIPPGEYGGGTVMVWDKGTWSPEIPDVDVALRRESLSSHYMARKLKGSWVLVWGRGGRRPVWLLIKLKDKFASKRDITQEEPRSVISNRTLAEIACDEGGDVALAVGGDPPALEAPWNSNRIHRPTKPGRSASVTTVALEHSCSGSESLSSKLCVKI